MKALLKLLFIAVAAMSFTFVSAQDKTTNTNKTTKTTKTTKTKHKAKHKTAKKSAKGAGLTNTKEKPTNAAVDQNSMKKKPAGK